MTPALEMLMNSRKVKTEQEVEEEFKLRQKGIPSGGSTQTKKKNNFQITELIEEDQSGEQFGENRQKSQNLLLPSHVETMREVYENLDKYKD